MIDIQVERMHTSTTQGGRFVVYIPCEN